MLVGWVATIESALARAPRIRLDVLQRDPRDLLRGDYVALRFAIDEIPEAAFGHGEAPRPGDTVWVALRPAGDGWEMASAATQRDAVAAADPRLIRGQVTSTYRGVHVDYGLGRYYVPEGRGTLPRGRLQAEIALPDGGGAYLTRLFIDGRPYP